MKTILILLLLFIVSCNSNITLPLKVASKTIHDEGRCYLILERFDGANRLLEKYETPWDTRYCTYEVGQEIK